MDLPGDTSLPFFAYGIFKPGELGFLQLRDFVETCKKPCEIKGTLRIRDGLPILDPNGAGNVDGAVLNFAQGKECHAYGRIVQLEPEHQYRWDVATVAQRRVNYLAGKSPQKGSIPYDEADWSGKEDPLFSAALEVVAETLEESREFSWDLKPLFRLEMAYLLLWSSIERYCSFRYGLGEDVVTKIMPMAQEPAFVTPLNDVLRDCRPEPIRVFRADRPRDSYKLSADDPEESLLYYYQIRCNATHRGKGVVRDHDRLEKALSQLLTIFRQVLRAAFEESAKCPNDQTAKAD